MESTIGGKVSYTRSTGLQVPTKVVGHSDKGFVELEYHQDGVQVVNHRCPMDWTPSPFVSPVLIHPRNLRKSLPPSQVMRVMAALFEGGWCVCSTHAVQGLPLWGRNLKELVSFFYFWGPLWTLFLLLIPGVACLIICVKRPPPPRIRMLARPHARRRTGK